MAETQRERGLPSLNQARAERRSAMRRGKYSLRGQLMPRFWLWAGVVLSGAMVIYWRLSQGQLESEKSRIMAKQRAVAAALTPEVIPYTTKIQEWAAELSGQWQGDTIAPDVDLDSIRTRPGIYLRLRREAAADSSLLRKEAEQSLLDGFVACMFVREGEADPRHGPPCEGSVDCDPGLLCNEYEVCTRPPRPFNMRLAYSALRVLDSSWSDELHEATNDLKVRAFERELERVSKNDVPIAIRMMKQSEFCTLVLDEQPEDGLPERLDAQETTEQRIQRTPHRARVAVWDLQTGTQLLRVRARAHGKFVPVGDQHVARVPPENRSEQQQRSVAAQARQANSCALALGVKSRVNSWIAKRDRAGATPTRAAARKPRVPGGESAGQD